MSNRRMFLMLLGASILFLASACASQATSTPAKPSPTTSSQDAAWAKIVDAAKKEGTLTIYSPYFVGDINRRISQDFQKQYGIKVEILVGSGRQGLEKVKVEQSIGKPIASIMGASGGSIAELVMAGLAVPTAQELPELRDKSKFISDPVYSPGGEVIVYALEISPTMINTNLVKPQDEPKSWMDYLDPKWKGKILTPDPRATGSTHFYYSLRFFKVIDLDYISRLAKQNMAIWGATSIEGQRMVARGEYSSFLLGPLTGITSLVATGAPVKPLAMKEGDIASSVSNAMVKNAPHPNAAKLFLNWMLTPEGQTAYHEVAGTKPFRKGMPDFTIPEARLPNAKEIAATWASEEWSAKELKAGTMAEIFGAK